MKFDVNHPRLLTRKRDLQVKLKVFSMELLGVIESNGSMAQEGIGWDFKLAFCSPHLFQPMLKNSTKVNIDVFSLPRMAECTMSSNVLLSCCFTDFYDFLIQKKTFLLDSWDFSQLSLYEMVCHFLEPAFN